MAPKWSASVTSGLPWYPCSVAGEVSSCRSRSLLLGFSTAELLFSLPTLFFRRSQSVQPPSGWGDRAGAALSKESSPLGSVCYTYIEMEFSYGKGLSLPIHLFSHCVARVPVFHTSYLQQYIDFFCCSTCRGLSHWELFKFGTSVPLTYPLMSWYYYKMLQILVFPAWGWGSAISPKCPRSSYRRW